jgi:hypothetical protein
MSKSNTRRGGIVLASVGALLTVAFAAAPQAEASTIYACVKKTSGGLRIVNQRTKCRKSELKLSWNTSGKNGANGQNGKNGTNGTNGTPGAAGKEGKEGKEGKSGEAGSALGYASVSATGVLDTSHSKGVVAVTVPSPGVYCFDLSFTPNVATADAKHISGNFKMFTETSAGTADVEAFTGACAAPDNDATVLTLDGSTIAPDGFYVSFN